jgi:hypothetical protein
MRAELGEQMHDTRQIALVVVRLLVPLEPEGALFSVSCNRGCWNNCERICETKLSLIATYSEILHSKELRR